MQRNVIYNEDCLVGMNRIPDGSVDMILTDLPYGTTACSWDEVIPFEPMWAQFERVVKDDGAIVLTASQPFTSRLVSSNVEHFRYGWVWNKKSAGNPFLVRRQPLKIHEDIVVFSKKPHVYVPQMVEGVLRAKGGEYGDKNRTWGTSTEQKVDDQYYPKSIVEFSNAKQGSKVHPTQKPVALFEYLIKTYTNKGELVLDATMGSGTTAIAALNTDREYIGFEMDREYFELAQNRIDNHVIQETLF